MIHAYTKNAVRISLIIGVVAMLGIAVWTRADALGSTFATGSGTGALELKIDSKTWYNGVYQPALSWTLKNLTPGVDKFFNFGDVKPGDTGTSSISIHIKPNPAWMCLDFVNLKDLENSINEPESKLDTSTSTGELAEGLEFFAWRDDGDYKFEIGEKPLFGTSSQSAVQVLNNTTYPLADAVTLPAYAGNSTHYVGINWCAGNLTVDIALAKITCDGTALGNEAQTDSLGIDVRLRAVSATQQPKFTCNNVPPPPEQCEIEGHKYDQNGKPLANWTMGLMKIITHNKGTDIYDLATDVTDADGYYCLNWDGETRTIRGASTYKSGPYNFTYHVYEKLVTGWKNVSIEKGSSVPTLAVVPNGDIKKDGVYISTQIGSQNGYIYSNAAYHVDFYNQLKKDKTKTLKKGNHGHGNDADHNDNSNPGNSNTVSDTTDDDRLPGKGKVAKVESSNWYKKDDSKSSVKEKLTNLLKKIKNGNRT